MPIWKTVTGNVFAPRCDAIAPTRTFPLKRSCGRQPQCGLGRQVIDAGFTRTVRRRVHDCTKHGDELRAHLTFVASGERNVTFQAIDSSLAFT